jgi:hypothetical protein
LVANKINNLVLGRASREWGPVSLSDSRLGQGTGAALIFQKASPCTQPGM